MEVPWKLVHQLDNRDGLIKLFRLSIREVLLLDNVRLVIWSYGMNFRIQEVVRRVWESIGSFNELVWRSNTWWNKLPIGMMAFGIIGIREISPVLKMINIVFENVYYQE